MCVRACVRACVCVKMKLFLFPFKHLHIHKYIHVTSYKYWKYGEVIAIFPFLTTIPYGSIKST